MTCYPYLEPAMIDIYKIIIDMKDIYATYILYYFTIIIFYYQ